MSTRFVGRTGPLTALLGALERVGRGSSTTVLIGGDAGIGKSFLVAEVVRRARERGAEAVVGNCLRLGEGGLPYAPFVEALTTLAGVIGTDALRRLGGPNGAALGRLLPGIEVDSRPSPSSSEKTILYEVVLAVLERLAEQAPLVLVVEDLHWAEISTQDLLAFLVHRLRGRVLVLATHRNDEVCRGDPPSRRFWPSSVDAGMSSAWSSADLGEPNCASSCVASSAEGRHPISSMTSSAGQTGTRFSSRSSWPPSPRAKPRFGRPCTRSS